ncbi:MAG TPA: YetF domain-containing protein [Allosphingosinicella sp.]|jgi:uncharacterized membrane protein YcaP (DUF421 family)
MEIFETALGLDRQSMDLTIGQMALRAAVTYAVTLAIVRLGKKRFMGSNSAFDVIVGIILGSTVSRGLTGNAPLGPTLAAAAAIVAMHWLVSGLALHWRGFSRLAKGDARLLVRAGTPDEAALRKVHMTQGDLDEELRGHGHADASRVAEARIERSGRVSIIEAAGEDRILEVAVADGVQTIRIQLARG